jgi:hypothetical protein
VSAGKQQTDDSTPGCLLEAIERPVEPADHVRTGRINEPRRLTAVNCLSEKAMQKGILDVQLMDGPGPSKSQREHYADGGWLHHQAEGLIIVDPRALSEAPESPASLVALESAISPTLVGPDPLAGDDVGA